MDSQIDIRGVLSLLRRRLALILGCVVLVVGAVVGLALLTPPVYSASALILFDPSRNNVLERDAGAGAADNARVQSEVELVASPAVLERVVADHGLAADPGLSSSPDGLSGVLAALGIGQARTPDGDWATQAAIERLRDGLRVSRRGMTYLIAVEMRAPDPRRAAQLANAVAEAYIADQVASKVEAVLAARDVLERLTLAAETELAAMAPQPPLGAIASLNNRLFLDGNLRIEGFYQALDGYPGAGPAERIGPENSLAEQASVIALAQYQSLLTRLADLEVQSGLQLADSRIVAPASTPAAPVRPDLGLLLAGAALGALGLGIAVALLYEHYVGGFSAADQVAAVLRVPVAAAVPRHRPALLGEHGTAGHAADQIVAAPLSGYAEAIRRLRAGLDHLRADGDGEGDARGKIVMVASSTAGEGKTATAIALARAYALAGQKALLIDCDLRDPDVHHQMAIETSLGLLDYLIAPDESVRLTDITTTDAATGLSVLVGARSSDLPTDQAIAGPAFARMLTAAAASFDVVVLDTAPLSPIVDSHYIARHADLIAFVVKWASTSQSDARHALAQLQIVKPPHAAMVAVLNGVEGRDRALRRVHARVPRLPARSAA